MGPAQRDQLQESTHKEFLLCLDWKGDGEILQLWTTHSPQWQFRILAFKPHQAEPR